MVTANKALLADHGNDIFRAAAEQGVDLAFEASVGGCMPIIKTLRESLVGNRIHSMTGILNGTCNYILSKITEEGIAFRRRPGRGPGRGLRRGRPDPGRGGLRHGPQAGHPHRPWPTAWKSTSTTSTSRGSPRITPLDIEFAGQFGYRIKLLAISKNRGDAVEARVHPTMIPFDNLLSNVNGTLNAVTITGDAVGDILLYGHGAGMMPTASAVIGRPGGHRPQPDGRRQPGACRCSAIQHETIRAIPDPADGPTSPTHYYFRFSALDQPGVLSTISGILGNHGISLKSVHQKGRKTDGAVPLVMLTHRAREADVQTGPGRDRCPWTWSPPDRC